MTKKEKTLETERKQYWLELAKLTLQKHRIPFIGNSSISQIVEELESDLIDTYPAETKYGRITGFYIYDAEGLILYELYATLKRHRYAGWTDIENIHDNNFRGPDWYFFKGYGGDRDGPGEWWFETLTEICEKHNNYIHELEQIKMNFVASGGNNE